LAALAGLIDKKIGECMATIFFSYSHKDETLRHKLEMHLSMLKRQGFIEAWHDRRITPGDVLDKTIGAHLERADIVLLLVSPDFLASDYCYEYEMARALERHDAGACRVIPVILRPCDWRHAPFGRLLAAPKDGKPITRWPDSDEAFLDVTQAIKSAVSHHQESANALSTLHRLYLGKRLSNARYVTHAAMKRIWYVREALIETVANA
jgi:TIR domain